MKAGIMQPYFFPYIGYFQLINSVDRFILFDDVQYIRHGWINRNRILSPVEGWQYIVIPLQKHQRDTLIRDVKIQVGNDWKEKINRQLEHYKKRAPYYNRVMELLQECFNTEETNVVRFNGHCLKMVCDYLNIPFKIEISSEMNFDYSAVHDAGEWALRISEQLHASEYINPPGGTELFDKTKFQSSGIQLSFQAPSILPYDQKRNSFEPGLSILDVMMFQGEKEIMQLIAG